MAGILAGPSIPFRRKGRLRRLAREVAVLRDKADLVGVPCQSNKLSHTFSSILCCHPAVTGLAWGQHIGVLHEYSEPLHE